MLPSSDAASSRSVTSIGEFAPDTTFNGSCKRSVLPEVADATYPRDVFTLIQYFPGARLSNSMPTSFGPVGGRIAPPLKAEKSSTVSTEMFRYRRGPLIAKVRPPTPMDTDPFQTLLLNSSFTTTGMVAKCASAKTGPSVGAP